MNVIMIFVISAYYIMMKHISKNKKKHLNSISIKQLKKNIIHYLVV